MRQLTTIILLLFTLASFGQDKLSNYSSNCIFVNEPMPSYPGGADSLKMFIKRNLKYPKGTADYTGIVYVGFTVTVDGTTTDFNIIKGLCDICDKSALETLKKMPKWIPAMVGDKPTMTRLVLPVKFEL